MAVVVVEGGGVCIDMVTAVEGGGGLVGLKGWLLLVMEIFWRESCCC